MFKKLAVIATIVMVALAALPGVALAHQASIQGVASCVDEEGNWSITWTLTTSETPPAVTTDDTTVDVVDGGVAPNITFPNITGNGSSQTTTNYDSGDSPTFPIRASGTIDWPDSGPDFVDSNNISEPEDCPPPDPEEGQITIEKDTNPETNSTEFDFDSNLPGHTDFDLEDDDKMSDTFAPGTYTISESPRAGWELVDIFCSGNAEFDIDEDDAEVRITLEDNDTAYCIFTNEPVNQVTPTTTPPGIITVACEGPNLVTRNNGVAVSSVGNAIQCRPLATATPAPAAQPAQPLKPPAAGDAGLKDQDEGSGMTPYFAGAAAFLAVSGGILIAVRRKRASVV